MIKEQTNKTTNTMTLAQVSEQREELIYINNEVVYATTDNEKHNLFKYIDRLDSMNVVEKLQPLHASIIEKAYNKYLSVLPEDNAL